MVCATENRIGSKIVGGFVLVRVAALMTAWRACQARPLGIGDFRTWLACHELEARRCAVEDDRAPIYGYTELARLLDVTEKRARASVNRLGVAGLLTWSDSAIEFLDPRIDLAGLDDTIGRGQGSLAIPRRMLRFLAHGARPALIATVLAILLRCLSRRKAGFDGRGRVKAAWIARVFGVDVRRVKAARRELVERGWIEPEPAPRWATNRWGGCYRIDLAWDRVKPGGSSLPLPHLADGPGLPPPVSDPEPLRERIQNQEPAGGPTGFSIKGSEDENKTLPAPTLDDVRIEDLKDTGRLLDLHRQAIDRKLVGSSEADRLKFFAAAEHAMAIGKGNPPGLFAWLVRNGCWRYLTGADEDRANTRIKAFLRGPELPRMAPSASRRPARPLLSEDARTVVRVRSALASAGYRGDPFPQVHRHDPSWTRERWDLALLELGS
jgi:hypothetical protein